MLLVIIMSKERGDMRRSRSPFKRLFGKASPRCRLACLFQNIDDVSEAENNVSGQTSQDEANEIEGAAPSRSASDVGQKQKEQMQTDEGKSQNGLPTPKSKKRPAEKDKKSKKVEESAESEDDGDLPSASLSTDSTCL